MADYFEKLVQNAQKGELYLVKMKNDNHLYYAIPMIPGQMQSIVPAKFLLKVVSPEERKGVYEYLLEDIELLKKQ